MLSVECVSLKQSAASVARLERFEEAKAPWYHRENRGDTNNVSESTKEDCKEALLRLMSKPGVSSAAQKMALNILMKMLLREGEEFDKLFFSKILQTMVKNREVVLLKYLAEKYFAQGDIRFHAYTIIGELCSLDDDIMKDMKACTQEAFTQKPSLGVTLCLAQPDFLSETADSRNSSNSILNTSDRDCVTEEEEEELNVCCKANVYDHGVVEEPDKQTCEEDLSVAISTAARVRDTEANNSVKTAPKRKGEEDDEDEDDDEEEQEEEGGDSGEEEDEPEQGGGGGGGAGNEEEEEEEEDNQVDEEEAEDEEDGEQQRVLPLNNNNTNTNNVNVNVGGEFDEEDDENDGRVDDEDEDEGDEDEDPDVEDDEETAPPKKKMKK